MDPRPVYGQDEATPFGAFKPASPQYDGMITQSVYLPMHDGVLLAAEVHLPKRLATGTRIPTLLSQTRYWRQSELRAPFRWFLKPEILDPFFRDFKPFFTSHGYALVVVDVRGTGASHGVWSHCWPDISNDDAYQVVDWIVAQSWSNGKVGAYGISYLGTTAELLAAIGHPAVRAVIPMFNHPDAYSDIALPGGAFNERFIREWSSLDETLDRNRVPDEFGRLGKLLIQGVKPVDGDKGRRFLAEAVREHEHNGDTYAMACKVTYRDDSPLDSGFCTEELAVHRFLEQIKRSGVAMFSWASWMDAGTADAAIRRFLTLQNAHRAVIGAWEHGGRFHASPYQPAGKPADPTLPVQWREMLRFFDAYLKDADNGVRSERAISYYTLGEEKWHKSPVWPPEGTRTQRWYLRENGVLSPQRPEAADGADRYTVDFEASTGEHNRWWELGVLKRETVIYRDRDTAGTHLLTYTSPPLEMDMEVTGYPVVSLFLTSTATDGNVFVYLEDMHPDGHVTYVTEGELRALHRRIASEPAPYHLQVPYHSFTSQDGLPLVPGEIAELAFGLQPTSALFRQGHRIRLGIAGHDKGTFARVPAEGTPVITIARNSRLASCLDLPVVPRR